jgi:hypothetical protein
METLLASPWWDTINRRRKLSNSISTLTQPWQPINLSNPEDADDTFSETSVRTRATWFKVPEGIYHRESIPEGIALPPLIIRNYVSAVIRVQPVNSNRWEAFSMQSVSTCYDDVYIGVVVSVAVWDGATRSVLSMQAATWPVVPVELQLLWYPLRSRSCELMLWEAGCCGRGQLRNPEEGEHQQLQTATKQRLVNTILYEVGPLYPIVICEMCRTGRAQSLLVVASCKSRVNPNKYFIHVCCRTAKKCGNTVNSPNSVTVNPDIG